jgi:hypothetical protein
MSDSLTSSALPSALVSAWRLARCKFDAEALGYPMTDQIRLIKHEAVTGSGSFEVRFPDGRASQYFYFDDQPSRRLRPEQLTRAEGLEQAKTLARDAREQEG